MPTQNTISLQYSFTISGCCKSWRPGSVETETESKKASSAIPQPLRWIESWETLGSSFHSHLTSQTARIRALWTKTPLALSSSALPGTPDWAATGCEDPFKKDSLGNSALDYAVRSQNLSALKRFTQTTSHKAFDSCKNIHQFFEVLFPSDPNRLPLNWTQFITNVPTSQELLEFEERMGREYLENTSSSLQNKNSPLDDPEKKETGETSLNEKKSNSPVLSNPNKNSVEILAEFLTNISFPFRLAWEIANKHQKLTLLETSDKEFLRKTNGEWIHRPGEQASYNSSTHTISISKNSPLGRKYKHLVFETFNALQRSSLLSLRKNPHLKREEYAFCNEWIETFTAVWCNLITGEGPITLSPEQIEKRWKLANTPSDQKFISHAEYYRHQWDYGMAVEYLGNNRDFLKTRLAELKTVSSN